MRVNGFQHVAILTADTERFVEFYGDVFGATVEAEMREGDDFRLTLVNLGGNAEFNVFELQGNDQAQSTAPMFGRGRLDHLGLNAASLEDFEAIRDRLVERGASDGFVTDFGPGLSVFFVDPDGLEAEVCIANPDWTPGDPMNPPGTPAKRYHDR